MLAVIQRNSSLLVDAMVDLATSGQRRNLLSFSDFAFSSTHSLTMKPAGHNAPVAYYFSSQ